METLPERQDPIKSLLSWFMSDEDVARYSDLSYVLDIIKKDELCWQAAVSIGVHAIVVVLSETDDQKALAESLAGYAVEPMEALHESLTQQAHEQPLTDEQARMLFHLRFALGFLFRAKGDHQQAAALLRKMAATKLSQYGGGPGWGSRSGGDIVEYSDDMGRAKDLTAYVMCDVYTETEGYEGALYLINEAADTTADRLSLLPRAADLLDRWAGMCERIEQEEDGFWASVPPFEWTDLLYSVVRTLEVCSYADTSGAPPGECDKASAQFFAYKLGQLAARFAAKMAALGPEYVMKRIADEEEPGRYDYLLHALLCEYAICSDWQKARDAFVTCWEPTPCYRGIPAEEIGPHTDLYWAMRIGFADKMLESTQALVLSAEPAPTTPVVPDFQALMDTVCGMDRKVDELRTGSSREVRGRVMRHLIPVSDLIPLKVLNHLEKAERYYKTKVNDDDAKVWFVKAVEAALADTFVHPLIDFMRQPPRGRERKGAAGLRKLKLWQWADVLDTLVRREGRDQSPVAIKDLRRFMDQRVGPRRPDFGPLAQCLRRVWQLRGGSAHHQQAETRLEKELWELQEMRKLVLGLGDSPPVIVQIYRLLAPSKQS